ncbi:tetratricopeptide repeat protein [Rhizomonospora bruguierae]|uniref:tetratricopeptide repeat protein n=1 Tax=Rhizomonospora bruguierae TaxID=1581705 RepID=UPI001BCCC0A0|nr:tetratricopeptide repeat protein [Micromonospora sp. NBRC 107566]
MRRLLRAHLVEQPALDRYTCHDLLRLYAREQLPDDDRAMSIARLLDWYLARVDAAARLLYPAMLRLDVDKGFEFLHRGEALEWLDAERANLVAAIRYAADHGRLHHAFQLSDALRGYFILRRPIADWTAAAAAGLAAAQAARDVRGQVTAHRNLANLHQSIGQQGLALRHHSVAIQLAEDCGWTEAELGTYSDRATIYIELGQLRTASDLLTRALALCAGVDVPHIEVHVHNNLAVTLLRMGAVESALDHLEQVLRLAADQQQLVGLAMANKAEACRLLRRYADARDLLSRALAIHWEMGNRYGEADVLVIMSRVQCEVGQTRQALDTARQALAITVESDDRNTEARAHHAIGEALRVSGAIGAALAAHRESLRIAEAVTDQYLVTEAHLGLAAAYRSAGESELARRYGRVAAEGARRGEFRHLHDLALALLAGVPG